MVKIGIAFGVLLAGLAGVVSPGASAAAVWDGGEGVERVKAAQAYRSGGEPVSPSPDGNIYCEAEEFKVEKPKLDGWKACWWGQNYYAATFANTFMSRKAFLGAPEDCDESVASINVDVKEAGKYLVLVRYEACYRFETQFKVRIEQGGAAKLDRLYGSRKNIKIWAFGSKLKDEVAWDWGAVENIVWEGHDAYAELQPGLAKITVTAGRQPTPQAKRNIDLVMLTKDEAQVKERIEKEKYLPLDGMLTQGGDVFIRITNAAAAKATLKSLKYPGGPMQQHSPYWTHIRNWKPVSAEVEPGATTDWIDVGGTMDTLNDGQWGFESSGPCKLEFGVRKADGKIESVRTMDISGKLPLVSLADMRYTPRIFTLDEMTKDLFDYLKALPEHGKKIERTRIEAMGGLPKDFYDFFGINMPVNGADKSLDCRKIPTAKLQETYGKMSEEERKQVLIMSLGDEIVLPKPDQKNANEGFTAFLKEHGVKPEEIDPDSGGDWSKISYPDISKPELEAALRTSKPGLCYWAYRYLYSYGIQSMKQRTDILRNLLPNAHIGANFSPHHGGGEHTFLGETFKWVTCFRDDGLLLPWSEDYAWQVPIGTQQMNGISLDLFRAGQRGKDGRKILYYVMPHSPGNIPSMWRRLWHNAIGHGATILNLFEFAPVWGAYTENHVTGKGMYAEVLRGIRELGLYEDIVQDGKVRAAQTALWFSETGDIWHDNLPPFGAAKRALYCAVIHNQVPLDFVVEQDATDGTLNSYKVLYLADRHVSRVASAKIAEWVKNGGKLFATAGAGMFDEYNQPNKILREVLGAEIMELDKTADQIVHFIKQDLPFINPMAEVTIKEGGAKFPVFGAVAKLKPAAGTDIPGTFADGSPAVVSNKAGKGEAITCAFLPGLSYFKPAIPLKPLDKSGAEGAMAHFIPTNFDKAAGALIGSALKDILRPAAAAEPLVAASIIEAKSGTAIVLENWTGKEIKGMALTVSMPGTKAKLASGRSIESKKEGDKTVFTFDMDESGDVLILR
jgi:hypothetical protein